MYVGFGEAKSTCMHECVFYKLCFLEKLQVRCKIKQRYRDFPYSPSSTYSQLPPLSTSPARVVHQLQLMDTLIHGYHSKSVVYVRLQDSWYCTCCGFVQIYNNMYPLLQYHTKSFHCSKYLLCFASSSLFCYPWRLPTFLLSPQFCPFPECHIIGILQYVNFSYLFLSLINIILKCLHVFSWLGQLISFQFYPVSRCTQFIFNTTTEGHLDYFPTGQL